MGVCGSSGSPLLTVTMENGAAEEAPRAVWLGRIAAVMEARGDRDEAVRLYGEAAVALTGGETSGRDDAGKTGTGSGAAANGNSPLSRVGGVGAGGSEAIVGGSGGSGDSSSVGGGTGNLFPYSARAHHLASMIERCYRRHFNR